MNSTSFGSFSSPNELSSYLERVYQTAINKLNNGAKRILILLPPGCGKTTMLCRIAKDITAEQGKNSIFISSMKLPIEMLKQKIGEEFSNAKFLTCAELRKNNYTELKGIEYIFVDDVMLFDRRELMSVLKDYKGISVTMNDPSQEVQHL